MPDTTRTQLRAVPDTGPTTAEDRLWATLHANPNTTAAELAGIAGIGRSTATKLLAAWAKDGTATRTSGIGTGGRRTADLWTITAETDDPKPDEDPQPKDDDAPSEPLALVPDESPTTLATQPLDHEPDVIQHTTEDSAPSTKPDQEAHPTSTLAAVPDIEADTDNVITPASSDPVAETHALRQRGRLAKGALRGMVEDFLAAHPGEAFGPSKIGKEIHRSGGAVANALEKLVADGYAIRVSESPKRYQAAPEATEPKEPATAE